MNRAHLLIGIIATLACASPTVAQQPRWTAPSDPAPSVGDPGQISARSAMLGIEVNGPEANGVPDDAETAARERALRRDAFIARIKAEFIAKFKAEEANKALGHQP